MPPRALLARNDERTILHFDYDCFYASVVENENPALRSVPLAIQQKQIIVTCNYEARRRGLFKLQLIAEAKKACPDVVIVLGEDLTRFRDASKDLYRLIRSYSWNDLVERLGFDEVWMDVSDLVAYNAQLLNEHSLGSSFFHLAKDDPMAGFAFDATAYAGHTYPKAAGPPKTPLERRLMLASHLALHVRHVLEEQKGYTCTVGVSTSKLLSKLVGNVNKPRGQTTLLPPYEPDQHEHSNVSAFLDTLDIGAIPGIGFKLAQKLREHALGRKPAFEQALVYGGTKEKVTVAQTRALPGLDPVSLEKLLAGPGSAHGIGTQVYRLLHGVDDADVQDARDIPRQISIEDSYIRLDTMDRAVSEMTSASTRLVERMRIDLTENQRWIGRPETLRLSTRPRPPVGPDGTRPRSFQRISRSAPLPRFVFNLDEHVDAIAARLVKETLVPLFKRLHPEKSGWNLSLLNVAVTNMVDVGGISKHAAGRDIYAMFAQQEDDDGSGQQRVRHAESGAGSGTGTDADADAGAGADCYWVKEEDPMEADDDDKIVFTCPDCGTSMPQFAQAAHARFHARGRHDE